MKEQFKLLVLTSIIGISTIVNNPTLAGDAKSIPGTNCRDTNNQNDVSYTFRGALINDLTVEGYYEGNVVKCPIIRDNMTAQNPHFVNDVKIQIYKRNTSFTTCALTSTTWNGRTGYGYFGDAVGTGYQTILSPGNN